MALIIGKAAIAVMTATFPRLSDLNRLASARSRGN
jgi:hypothetical protein